MHAHEMAVEMKTAFKRSMTNVAELGARAICGVAARACVAACRRRAERYASRGSIRSAENKQSLSGRRDLRGGDAVLPAKKPLLLGTFCAPVPRHHQVG